MIYPPLSPAEMNSEIAFLAVGINTRHTHVTLANAYLQAFWGRIPNRPVLHRLELDLNQLPEERFFRVLACKPLLAAFSTYIWNLDAVLSLAGALKAARPQTIIVLGGPEVSFQARQVMMVAPWVDVVVRGEGEATFEDLLNKVIMGKTWEGLSGLTHRIDGVITDEPDRPCLASLDLIPSPFQSGLYGSGKGFTYYEASRGCPFRCSFCLSSVQGPVRHHSLDRVKSDLDWFFQADYQQIRFADRTFNFDNDRAMAILEHIIAKNHRGVNFHFEIQAEFLHENIIEILAKAPPGQIHLEVGIQSTAPPVLAKVQRPFNPEILKKNIRLLKARTGCHLHLDLLGGLPGDTRETFLASLEEVLSWDPHTVQLGLVKVLRGTPLEKFVSSGELRCAPTPPYQVVATATQSAEELAHIHDMGRLIEPFANSNRFPGSIRFLAHSLHDGSFAGFFDQFTRFWRAEGWPFLHFSPERMRDGLLGWLTSRKPDVSILLAGQSLILHESQLCGKVPHDHRLPGAEELLPPKVTSPWKISRGHKLLWFPADPLPLRLNPKIELGTVLGPAPVWYRHEPDLSRSPSVQILDFSFRDRLITALLSRGDFLDGRKPLFWPEKAGPFPETREIKELLDLFLRENIVYTGRKAS